MKLSNSVKPISYLKAHASEMIKDVYDNHKTFIITQRGEAKVIVQDVVSFEKMNDSLALLKILALSANNLKTGKTKPLVHSFQSIRDRIKKEL
jgi:prevent-host-death family protein